MGDEPLKLTLDCSAFGYDGEKIAEVLRQNNIECEFYDRDVIVFMFAPNIEKDIYEINPDDIKTTKVDMTIVAGKTVFEREVSHG